MFCCVRYRLFGETRAIALRGGARKDTRHARVERDSGQNSGARRVDRMSLPLFADFLLECWATDVWAESWRAAGPSGIHMAATLNRPMGYCP